MCSIWNDRSKLLCFVVGTGFLYADPLMLDAQRQRPKLQFCSSTNLWRQQFAVLSALCIWTGDYHDASLGYHHRQVLLHTLKHVVQVEGQTIQLQSTITASSTKQNQSTYWCAVNTFAVVQLVHVLRWTFGETQLASDEWIQSQVDCASRSREHGHHSTGAHVATSRMENISMVARNGESIRPNVLHEIVLHDKKCQRLFCTDPWSTNAEWLIPAWGIDFVLSFGDWGNHVHECQHTAEKKSRLERKDFKMKVSHLVCYSRITKTLISEDVFWRLHLLKQKKFLALVLKCARAVTFSLQLKNWPVHVNHKWSSMTELRRPLTDCRTNPTTFGGQKNFATNNKKLSCEPFSLLDLEFLHENNSHGDWLDLLPRRRMHASKTDTCSWVDKKDTHVARIQDSRGKTKWTQNCS